MNANEHKYKQNLAKIHQLNDHVSSLLFYLGPWQPNDYEQLYFALSDAKNKSDMQIEYLTGCIEEYDPYLKEA